MNVIRIKSSSSKLSGALPAASLSGDSNSKVPQHLLLKEEGREGHHALRIPFTQISASAGGALGGIIIGSIVGTCLVSMARPAHAYLALDHCISLGYACCAYCCYFDPAMAPA
jgi:hypothetical protein